MSKNNYVDALDWLERKNIEVTGKHGEIADLWRECSEYVSYAQFRKAYHEYGDFVNDDGDEADEGKKLCKECKKPLDTNEILNHYYQEHPGSEFLDKFLDKTDSEGCEECGERTEMFFDNDGKLYEHIFCEDCCEDKSIDQVFVREVEEIDEED